MNMQFTFAVAIYVKDTSPTTAQEGQVAATGSTEDRARRRLLEHLHDKGLYARRVQLFAAKPAK